MNTPVPASIPSDRGGEASTPLEALALASIYLAQGLQLTADAIEALREETELRRSLECLAGAGMLCLTHLDDAMRAARAGWARAEEGAIAEG